MWRTGTDHWHRLYSVNNLREGDRVTSVSQLIQGLGWLGNRKDTCKGLEACVVACLVSLVVTFVVVLAGVLEDPKISVTFPKIKMKHSINITNPSSREVVV